MIPYARVRCVMQQMSLMITYFSNAAFLPAYGIILRVGWASEGICLLFTVLSVGLGKERVGHLGGSRSSLLLCHVLFIPFGMQEIDVFLRGSVLLWVTWLGRLKLMFTEFSFLCIPMF